MLTSSLRDLDGLSLCRGCKLLTIDLELPDLPTRSAPASWHSLAVGSRSTRTHRKKKHHSTPLVARDRVTPPMVLERAVFRRYYISQSFVRTRDSCGMYRRILGADGCTRGYGSPSRRNSAERCSVAEVLRESSPPRIHSRCIYTRCSVKEAYGAFYFALVLQGHDIYMVLIVIIHDRPTAAVGLSNIP